VENGIPPRKIQKRSKNEGSHTCYPDARYLKLDGIKNQLSGHHRYTNLGRFLNHTHLQRIQRLPTLQQRNHTPTMVQHAGGRHVTTNTETHTLTTSLRHLGRRLQQTPPTMGGGTELSAVNEERAEHGPTSHSTDG
jgi:hypothetical protein